MAATPLEARWTPALWFAWSRIIATCRIKRACTRESYPAAVLILRNHELCSILAIGRIDAARSCLQRLADVGVDVTTNVNGDITTLTVANYAKYQKLAVQAMGLRGSPPSDPPTLRTREEVREESRPENPAPDPPPKKRRESVPIPPEAEWFAAQFRTSLIAFHTDPPIKPPTDAAFAGWQREARLMLTVDQRSLEDLKRIGGWLFNDSGADAVFWRKNILSVGTFRKQFDRLAVAMKTPQNGGRDEFGGSKLLRFAAEAQHLKRRADRAAQDPGQIVLGVARLPSGEH